MIPVRLRLLLIAAVLLVGCYFLYGFATTSTLHITTDPLVSPLNASVTVDGKIATPSGPGGHIFTINVGRGNHTVVVTSSNHQDTELKVATSLRSNQQVQVKLSTIDANDIARLLVSTTDVTKVEDAVFFEDQSWLVFHAEAEELGSERVLIIARFDETLAQWDIMNDGDEIPIPVEEILLAPDSVKAYVRSLQ